MQNELTLNKAFGDIELESKEYNKEARQYADKMIEIKNRLKIIREVFDKKSDGIQKVFDTEIICHQFKCSIELILLASLAAHKKFYLDRLDKIKTLWRRDGLIKALKDVTDKFYPLSVKLNVNTRDGSG